MGSDRNTFFPQGHNHSDHSVRDGVSSISQYTDKINELGGTSLTLTEHGSASGYASQYFACKKAGIKPIYGMECYVQPNRKSGIRDEIAALRARLKKDKKNAGSIKADIERKTQWLKANFRPSKHSIVLAKTREGYSNLVRMSTDSWKNGYYYFPRTDFEFLADHAEGLIYSTACIGGHIPTIARKNFDEGVAEARRIRRMFADGFYVEIMMTEYPEQRHTNIMMMKLAKKLGCPMIITCDVHYVDKKGGDAQNIMLLMRDKKTIADKEAGEGGWQFDAKDLYWRTLEDVARCWKKYHSDYMPKDVFLQAVRNTYDLADSIENWDFDTSLKLPGLFDNPGHILKEAVKRGIRWRSDHGYFKLSGRSNRDYIDRAKRELDVISKKGFSEYFLVVKDITDHAREIGATVGCGRGSAAGSIVSYLLRITDIDPLRFNLLFERFLAVDRTDAPDIDLDFSPEHRPLIKDYIQERYPATASIGTFSKFKPRAILRDVGRVFGIDHKEMMLVTKQLDTDADDKTWDEIFELWPTVEQWAKKYPEAFSVVESLRGLISHRGKNAAGVLIAPESALSDLPMIVERDKDGKETVVTAFPDAQEDRQTGAGREISRLGYLKMDILGVQGLSIAPKALEIVTREHAETFDLERIPLDDKDALALASKGDVPGIFQFDSSTTRPILRHVGVDSFMDLVMITALARPGPLKHQIHKLFAKLKKTGDAWKEDIIPELVPLLEASRGLMILQEDVMFVVQAMGGFTFPEANAVRKIMAKKLDPEKLNEWERKFIEGGISKGHDRELLETIFDKVKTFAKYAFNRSHSVSYCMTAYRQLYMLAHYPTEYMAALMCYTDNDKKDTGGEKRLGRFINEAVKRGIQVLPPCVISSRYEFDVEDGKIRYGLAKIKGVSNSASYIVEARPFSTLEEFIEKVNTRKVNARVVAALIDAGAMDNLPFDSSEIEFEETDDLDVRNKLRMRYMQIRKSKKEFTRNTPSKMRELERDVLGANLSWWGTNKKDRLRDAYGLTTIKEAKESKKRKFDVIAEITAARVYTSKRGDMAFLTISDETGTLENFTVWVSEWKTYKKYLTKGRFAVICLERKENTNRQYGRWSYFLQKVKAGKPVLSDIAALRDIEE